MQVVFDFGAVLFAWRPVDIVREVFPARAATEADARQLAHAMFGHEDWHNFDRGLLAIDGVVERTAHRLDLDRRLVHTLIYGIGERLLPMGPSVAVLQSLLARKQAGTGVRGVYFLSNMPLPYARTLEQNNAFLRDFDGGIFSGDVLCSKPDPAIYKMLQSRHQLTPENTLFIDDMEANVAAAQALGWKGIHFTSAAQLADQLQHQFGL
jgi:putative hydrolase of the HAD superfamily